jgi:hypothetical protein
VTPDEVTPAHGLPQAPPAAPPPRPYVRRPGVDAINFTAACPDCGNDTDWFERRDDTRVVILIPCAVCRRHKSAA